MVGTEFIIQFKDNRAYLAKDIYLNFDQLELPEFIRQSDSKATWKLRILDYSTENNRIFADVLSYNAAHEPVLEMELFTEIEMAEVKSIGFRSIDTLALLKTIKPGKIQAPPLYSALGTTSVRHELTPKNIKETLSVPLQNISFKNGYVSFEKRIGNLGTESEFRVLNPHIREEFDAIKNYFGNVLKTKKIIFEITATVINNKVEEAQAVSEEINRIDGKLIESVKLEVVKNIASNKLEDHNIKTLLTIDDLFEVITQNKMLAAVFFEDEKNFLEDILNISGTKHYKNLEYLSQRHAFTLSTLRFAINPFSFIFLISGQNKFHIVWETLNTTEATYIWHAEKDSEILKTELLKIEQILKNIKYSGRTCYLSKSEKDFTRIFHDYSDLVTGFAKWKKEIEKATV